MKGTKIWLMVCPKCGYVNRSPIDLTGPEGGIAHNCPSKERTVLKFDRLEIEGEDKPDASLR